MSNTENEPRTKDESADNWECWQILGKDSFTQFVSDIRSMDPDGRYRITDLVDQSQLAHSTIRGQKYHELAVELGLLETDGTWYYINESSEVSVVLDVLNSVITQQVEGDLSE